MGNGRGVRKQRIKGGIAREGKVGKGSRKQACSLTL